MKRSLLTKDKSTGNPASVIATAAEVATPVATAPATTEAATLLVVGSTLEVGLGREEPVDPLHVGPEVEELLVEQLEGAVHHLALLSLAGGNFGHLKE